MSVRKLSPQAPWDFRSVLLLNQVLDGKTNNTGSVTLTANSATTTLTNPLITATSVITFSPQTANAATATGNLYVSAKADGSATLTHANNAQADRTFDYVVTGV